MEHKSFAVSELKALDTDQPGTFEAIVSVFGNTDRGGDIVEKGAFAKSLSERGLPPLVWSHEWQTPPIGATLKAEELDEGLYIKGRLFVGEGEDSPVARAVYTAMKAQDGNGKSVLREFSFGYEAQDYEILGEGDDRVRHLKQVDILEAGPTLVGMNPETRLVGIKSLEQAVAAAVVLEGKTGRVLSKGNETKLRDALALITEVVSAVEEDPKNFSADDGAEKKDSPAEDKDTAKDSETDTEPEEPSEDLAAVLLADPHDRRSTASSKE